MVAKVSIVESGDCVISTIVVTGVEQAILRGEDPVGEVIASPAVTADGIANA
ncbi:hypothetical protein ACFSW8_16855 [Rubritalea tangerina]|uniref:Uncharacterized protein n=1 Tax=Rubritalea tangerina TaxID=430798 RepID=A0ABW4ZFF0_9BACT